MSSLLPAVVSLGGMGFLLGMGLALAAKKFAVLIDKRQVEVLKALPGVNCGACGYAGCEAFAEAVLKGDAPPDGCRPGGKKAAAKIAQILNAPHTF